MKKRLARNENTRRTQSQTFVVIFNNNNSLMGFGWKPEQPSRYTYADWFSLSTVKSHTEFFYFLFNPKCWFYSEISHNNLCFDCCCCWSNKFHNTIGKSSENETNLFKYIPITIPFVWLPLIKFWYYHGIYQWIDESHEMWKKENLIKCYISTKWLIYPKEMWKKMQSTVFPCFPKSDTTNSSNCRNNIGNNFSRQWLINISDSFENNNNVLGVSFHSSMTISNKWEDGIDLPIYET